MLKYLLNLLLVFVLSVSCNKVFFPTKNWSEVGYNARTEIKEGIQAYDAVSVDYEQNDKVILNVKLEEPVVVDVAKKVEKWGYFQFPNIRTTKDGILVVSWNMADDAVSSYGKGNSGISISDDGGKTWNKPTTESLAGGGTALPNGDRIAVHTPKALKLEDLQLSNPVDSSKENYGRDFVYYRLSELPEELQGVYLNRMSKNSDSWSREHVKLHDPTAVRYTDSGLFPVVWWGDMNVIPDGSIIAGIYPGFYLDENMEVPPSGVLFYRSTDNGHSWNIHGKIPYQPDLTTDPNGNRREALGYTEPASLLLSNGTFLCVMRTTDGLGNSPMYLSHSKDMGKTWTKPSTFTRSGVLPKLLQLDNGVIVLASGRPGMQLRFSIDGKGEKWTDPFEMLPFNNSKDAVSCGYPSIIATGSNKFLLVYSDFKYEIGTGEFRKAIKVREITVNPINDNL